MAEAAKAGSVHESPVRRLFATKPHETPKESSPSDGVYDSRNDVHFEQGFEAFRTYKGKEYKAIAENGIWRRLDTGDQFSTLNQLNETIVAGNENVWNGNWKYRTAEGKSLPINSLRR